MTKTSQATFHLSVLAAGALLATAAQAQDVQTVKIAHALEVIGMMNIQFAVKDGQVYVLEVNPRASRTVPFVAKATGISFANLATKAGVEGAGLRIHAPLLRLSKADIVREGMRLGVDFSQTVSCYQADDQGRACGHCDACRLRAAGFADAGVPDPTHYA